MHITFEQIKLNGISWTDKEERDDIAEFIESLGFSKYKQAFIDSGINRSALWDLASNDELAEVGIDLSSYTFERFLQKLQEVPDFVLYHYFLKLNLIVFVRLKCKK